MPSDDRDGRTQADADTANDAARAVRNQDCVSSSAHSSSDYRSIVEYSIKGERRSNRVGSGHCTTGAASRQSGNRRREDRTKDPAVCTAVYCAPLSRDSPIFDRGRREAWFFAMLAVLLVLIRSAVFLSGDTSTSIPTRRSSGLMAKHLSEFRTFPLFFYGQNYMLGVQSWIIAPFFWIARPSIAVLKTPLVAAQRRWRPCC